jgi:GntR family transcriptional regulator
MVLPMSGAPAEKGLAQAAEPGIAARMATIGARDAIPLYHRIYLTLRDEILSGERVFGTPVPTEQELGAMHGVSRITARRALDELAQHGLVERKRRIGTRVTFRAPAAPIEGHIDQAVESLIAFGHGTQVRVIEFGEVPASAVVAERLTLQASAPVVRALRIRLTDDAPLGAIESFVPAAIGAVLSRENLTRQPLLELIRAAGHTIGAGTQSISAVPADPALAALLDIEARAAIIRIDRVVRDADGRPLLFTSARYRGDRYRLSLDLQGGGQQAIAAAISPAS